MKNSTIYIVMKVIALMALWPKTTIYWQVVWMIGGASLIGLLYAYTRRAKKSKDVY